MERISDRDYWGTHIFSMGLILLVSPFITAFFAAPMAVLLIMLAGFAVTVFGFFLALS
jgi:hypothetical protein